MKRATLGKSGIECSRVAFGAWTIGGWMWGGVEKKEAIRAIHAALNCGIDLIDTAPVYGFGLSEELIGEALKDKRHEAVIATKCGLIWHCSEGELFFHSDEKHPSMEESKYAVYRCLKPETVRHEVEKSLRRLKTDYIDLYQTHFQDPTTPIGDTMETLEQLKREGKIRSIGVCNANCSEMAEYSKFGTIVCDQENYSLLRREQEKKNLPYCSKHGLSFLPYSPLARGLLSGKLDEKRPLKEGDQRLLNNGYSVDTRRRVIAALERLKALRNAKGATYAQLAIAWILGRLPFAQVLAGARTAEQVEENARASDIHLSEDELEEISEALTFPHTGS